MQIRTPVCEILSHLRSSLDAMDLDWSEGGQTKPVLKSEVSERVFLSFKLENMITSSKVLLLDLFPRVIHNP